MRQATKLIAMLLAGSAFAAAPALASNMDGVARGPAQDNAMMGVPNTGAGTGTGWNTGASTANGNTVVRSTNKSENAENGWTDNIHTGSIGIRPGAAGSGTSRLETWNVRNVRVVNVNTLSASSHANADSVATNISPRDRQEIWNSLESSPRIRRVLNARSITRSRVVAANYDGNGTMTVYVN